MLSSLVLPLHPHCLTSVVIWSSHSSLSIIWIFAMASVSCRISLLAQGRVRPFLPLLSMAALWTATHKPCDQLVGIGTDSFVIDTYSYSIAHFPKLAAYTQGRETQITFCFRRRENAGNSHCSHSTEYELNCKITSLTIFKLLKPVSIKSICMI